MAIHLSRDYVTQNVSISLNRWYIYAYLISIFTRRVLGFSYVGDTSFNINSIGSLLIATGDSTPTVAPTFAAGTKAGINFGAGFEFEVSIPIAVRTVVSGDIGRILVLKSTANPRYNSGIFLITGINTTSNRYVIDYRTLGDNPPVEAADTLPWYLYEKDISCPIGTSSAGSGYRGDGASTTPRLILQSPHALAWQLRICTENFLDASASAVPMVSTVPGYGGDAFGDFAAAGPHLHPALWYDSQTTTYIGTTGAGDSASGVATQYRFTMIGDDTGQSCSTMIRRTVLGSSPPSHFTSYGIPDNEPTPIPTQNVSRLYTLGVLSVGANGGDAMGDISFSTKLGTATAVAAVAGMGATPSGVPASCSPSIWTYVTGPAQGASPIFDSSAADCPWTSSTELLPVDLVVGTRDSWLATTSPVYPYEPRVIGTIPFLKSGRTNFGNWSPTTDASRSYQHIKNGVYMLWEGPSIVP